MLKFFKNFVALRSVFILIIIFFAFSQTQTVFAVGEICSINASCCTPPMSIIVGGGCPTGEYWIGPSIGGYCKTSTVTCTAPSNFNCSTGACTSVSTPGTGCAGWQLNLGGGQCVDVLKIIKESVNPAILQIYNGGYIGNVVYEKAIDGRVGIGTTAPAQKLHVVGNSALMGKVGIGTVSPDATSQLDVLGKTRTTNLAITGQANCSFPYNSLKTDASGNIGCDIISDSDWYRQFSGADHMYNMNAGNVGIGTNTPQNKLDVEGSTAIGATYSGSFAAPANGLIVQGNVGIGKTNPSQALDVTGNTAVSGNITTNTLRVSSLSCLPSNKQAVVTDSSGNFICGSTDDGDWMISGSNIYRSSGNVGIGLTPSYKLHVSGQSYFTSNVGIGSGLPDGNIGLNVNSSGIYGVMAKGPVVGLHGESTWWGTGVYGTGANYGVHGVSSNIGVGGQGSNYAGYFEGRGYFSGNVGIGTTNPDRRLTVYNSSNTYLNVKDSSREVLLGVDGNGGILSVMTNHPLMFRSGGNIERMRIMESGNVGIGKTNPNYKLDVNGIVAGTMLLSNGNSSIGIYASGTHIDGVRALGSTNGVIGISTNIGVSGYTNGGSNSYGVIGQAASYGTGVRGVSVYTIGVSGQGGSMGVFGKCTGGGQCVGIQAESSSGTGLLAAGKTTGVSGNCTDSNCYGLWSDKRSGGTTQWYNMSDEQLKTNIRTIDSAISKIEKIRGVEFEWQNKEDFDLPAGNQLGFIAQEIIDIFPEAVNKDSNGYYSVSTASITPVLVEAVKELKAENDKLKARILAIENSNE